MNVELVLATRMLKRASIIYILCPLLFLIRSQFNLEFFGLLATKFNLSDFKKPFCSNSESCVGVRYGIRKCVSMKCYSTKYSECSARIRSISEKITLR